jgi:hypothetical protein
VFLLFDKKNENPKKKKNLQVFLTCNIRSFELEKIDLHLRI